MNRKLYTATRSSWELSGKTQAHQLRDVYKARLRDDNTEATITIRLHEEKSKNA